MAKFKGDLKKALRQIEKKLERATGNVPLPDLMPPSFVQRHTRFSDLQEMVDAAPESEAATTDAESAAYLQGPVWDRFVAENSDFSGWREMVKKAGDEHVRRNI